MKSILVKLLSYCFIAHCASVYLFSADKSTSENFIPQDFDVLHYEIDIAIDSLGADSLYGNTRIELQWMTPEKGVFYIDLHRLEIESITDITSETELDFEILLDTMDNSEYIRIDQTSTYQTGDTAVYSVTYQRELTSNKNRSGLMVKEQIYVLGVGFYDEWVSMGRDWFPCYDHPSDKATFNITITSKPDLFSVANGLLVADEEIEGKRQRTFSMNSQMTTYLATFALGELLVIDQEYPVYCSEEVYDRTSEIVDIIPTAVDFFSTVFGEYPFESLGYVMVEDGTIEQQALIMQDEAVVLSDYNKGDTTTLTTIHELAHQWFGNDVSVYDFRDAWLSESFATYAEILWVEHLQGKEKAIELLRQKFIDMLSHNSNEEPLYDYDRDRYTNYPLTIYFKGAVVLDMLRHSIGDESFFNLLKEYQATYSGGNCSTELFLEMLNEYIPLGFDLDGFANSYIYGGGYARLHIDTYNGNDNQLGIKVTQTNDNILSPLILELVVAMNDDTQFSIYDTMTSKELLIETQLPDGYSVSDVRRIYTNHNKYKNQEITPYAWVIGYSSVQEKNIEEQPGISLPSIALEKDQLTSFIAEKFSDKQDLVIIDVLGRESSIESLLAYQPNGIYILIHKGSPSYKLYVN